MRTNPKKDMVLHRLEALRDGLNHLADAIEDQANASGMVLQSLSADGAITGDAMDIAQVLAGRATTEGLTDLLAARREQVEHAIDRLGNGTYGRCEDCGAKIPIERLDFQPEATRCVSCQQWLERRNHLVS